MNASDILNRLTSHRNSQVESVGYYLTQDEQTGQKVRWCGTWLHLREWLQSQESRLMSANFCKKTLLCRACAARRAGKLVEAYEGKVSALLADNPSAIPAMLTLTVKNGPDLLERFNHLNEAWKLMIAARRRHYDKPDRHGMVEACRMQGWVKSVEVTRGKDGGWHPHLHVFALLGSYIDQKALSAEWEAWTGDSKIVGVTKCKNGILPGLVEVLKYSTKFAELEPSQSWHIHQTLGGCRLVDPGGSLRGVKYGPLDQDSIDGMEGPYRDFIALWAGNGYKLHEAETNGVAAPGLGPAFAPRIKGLQVTIERPAKP